MFQRNAKKWLKKVIEEDENKTKDEHKEINKTEQATDLISKKEKLLLSYYKRKEEIKISIEILKTEDKELDTQILFLEKELKKDNIQHFQEQYSSLQIKINCLDKLYKEAFNTLKENNNDKEIDFFSINVSITDDKNTLDEYQKIKQQYLIKKGDLNKEKNKLSKQLLGFIVSNKNIKIEDSIEEENSNKKEINDILESVKDINTQTDIFETIDKGISDFLITDITTSLKDNNILIDELDDFFEDD